MKTRFFVHGFFLSFCALFFGACNGNDSRPHYNLDDEFRDFCLYHNGSYWVYQDSASGVIDTIRQISSRFEKLDGEKADIVDGTLEYVFIESYSTHKKSIIDFTGGAQGTDSRTSRIKSDFWYEERGTYYGIDVFRSAMEPGMYGSTAKLETKSADYTNGIVSFKNIWVFSYDGPYYHPEEVTKTYWKRHVGLVKKELLNGQVWNLIKYKVAQ